MSKIMVAIDGSISAERALDFAAGLARTLGRTLLIVTISDELTGAEINELSRNRATTADTLGSLSEQLLADARVRAEQIGVSDIQTISNPGEVVQGIIHVVQHEKPDVLVVGRRGHGRLAELLLGSVSHKLVSLAPCPVVVVP